MYEILYKDQVIVSDENIDIYLEIIKFNFLMEMLKPTFEELEFQYRKGYYDWKDPSLYMFSHKKKWELYFSKEMLNYHIKNLRTDEVTDIIDMFALRDVFPPSNIIRELEYKYPNKQFHQYYKNHDALAFEDTLGYRSHRVNCGEPLNRLLKQVRCMPWYYTDEVKRDFKRYSTYCKDELIGRSDFCFKVLCDYIGELDEIVKREWHRSEWCIGVYDSVAKLGQNEWYHGEVDKQGRKIGDFYIKDLLTNDVITDFRSLQYFYVNPNFIDKLHELLLIYHNVFSYEDLCRLSKLQDSSSCSKVLNYFVFDNDDIDYKSFCEPVPLWEENVGIGKEFDWASKYGPNDN